MTWSGAVGVTKTSKSIDEPPEAGAGPLSPGRFCEQLFYDRFHAVWLQSNGSDNPFAIHNRISGIVMHLPRFLGGKLWITRGRILYAPVLRDLLHLFLSPV